MLFDWLDAREAASMGTTLADDLVTQAASESRPKNAGLDTRSYLEKFAQKVLTRVDHEARPLKLNLFKRAKLANSFKWRLLEKGVERGIADELAHALLVRLSAGPQPAGPTPSESRRAARGTVVTLLAEGNQALARGDDTEAIRSYEAALARDSRHPEALYKRALDVDSNAHGSWAALARLRRMTPADGAWLKGAEACATHGLAPHNEADVRYALGKYYDDVGDFKRAFSSYQRANELQKLAAEPYDRGARTQFVDDLIRTYTSETIGGARAGASGSMRPAFVVGMPRSGTTLVAQVIHSPP